MNTEFTKYGDIKPGFDQVRYQAEALIEMYDDNSVEYEVYCITELTKMNERNNQLEERIKQLEKFITKYNALNE